MRIVPITSVVVPPDRVRKKRDPKKFASLIEDIRTNGIYHPPVVRGLSPITLVAGEGRYTACAQLIAEGVRIRYGGEELPVGTIPVHQIEEMDETQAIEIEIKENLEREELSWQDRVLGLERLSILRQSQFVPVAEVIKEAADISGRQKQEVRDALLIAKHMDNPQVAKAGSEKEAFKLIERTQRAVLEAELAKRLGHSTNSSPHTFILGSCLEVLKTLPDAAFDGIVTDPPYGIEAHTFTPQSGSENAMLHTYDDSFENARDIVEAIAKEGARVCKPTAYLYMFSAWQYVEYWTGFLKANGWDVWPYPIIWHKTNAGNLLGNCDGPRHVYECIIYARRGGKGVNTVKPDVIPHVAVKGDVHAAEKPANLLLDLLVRSATPGDAILDPCCGSGSLFTAASLLHLKATGIEIDPAKASTAQLRAACVEVPEEAPPTVPISEGDTF